MADRCFREKGRYRWHLVRETYHLSRRTRTELIVGVTGIRMMIYPEFQQLPYIRNYEQICLTRSVCNLFHTLDTLLER